MTQPPLTLVGATDFSDDRQHLHPLWLVQMLKAFPQFLQPLRDASAACESQFGRGRIKGDWTLAYAAFTFSRFADIQPWWGQGAGHSIWKAAGFAERPSYQACHARFTELEKHAEAFQRVAERMIAHAAKHTNGEVGRFLHVDSTEAETHARLKHICPPDSPCRKRLKGLRVSATVPVETVREERHDQGELPEPDAEQAKLPELGEGTDLIKHSDGTITFKLKNCHYELLDTTAGVRAYTGPDGKVRTFWVGFYNGKAIDHYTGAPVSVHVTSASIREHTSYPDLYAKAVAATGRHPEAVVADRGYSISSVFEHNTRRGVASVMPWRKSAGVTDRAKMDKDRHDRHGIVRCKHCGGETKFVRFSANENDPAGPRLWAQCLSPVLPSCGKQQTVYCRDNWRMFLPMWRTEPTYMALKHSHDRYERVHELWRRRYNVGADDHALRPKRRGITCQQLRANAALMVEWLIILWRENWLTSARGVVRRKPRDTVIAEDHGRHWVVRFKKMRERFGLHQPYGPKAVEQKVGKLKPIPGAPGPKGKGDPVDDS